MVPAAQVKCVLCCLRGNERIPLVSKLYVAAAVALSAVIAVAAWRRHSQFTAVSNLINEYAQSFLAAERFLSRRRCAHARRNNPNNPINLYEQMVGLARFELATTGLGIGVFPSKLLVFNRS